MADALTETDESRRSGFTLLVAGEFFGEEADVWGVAVDFGVVHAVADDEAVGDWKPT